jgi:hypothetical protein
MHIEIGRVEAIFRYPVKSMGGERLEVVKLGWHGLDGDRRLAFRRINDRGGFPWLTASELPDLLLFTPHRGRDGANGGLAAHDLRRGHSHHSTGGWTDPIPSCEDGSCRGYMNRPFSALNGFRRMNPGRLPWV